MKKEKPLHAVASGRQAVILPKQKPLRQRTAGGRKTGSPPPRPVHELQTRQIGQESQNDELRRAPGELEAVRARYFDFYEQAPMGYCTLSAKGSILEANLSFARLLGEERDALREEPLTRFILPEDQALNEQRIKQLLATRTPQTWDVRLLRADGSSFWAHVQATSARNGECWLTVHDITERKEVELRLSTQARVADIFMTSSDEEVFENVINVILDVLHSPLGFLGYLDEAGDLVVPAMSRIVWSKYQVPGKTTTLPRHTWGESGWARALREKKTSCSNVRPFTTPKGHPTIRRHISVPILFQDKVLGLFQIANKEEDYTAADIASLEAVTQYIAPILNARLHRQLSLEALRKSEESYRLQFVNNSSVKLLLDPADGRIVDANAAALAFYGYPPDRFLAMGLSEISTLSAAEMQAFLLQIKEEQGGRFECLHRLANGSEREVEVSTSRILHGGRPVLHLIIHDITKRKIAERELRRHIETYQDILSTTLDGFWLVDFQGRLLDVNESYIRSSGYSRQELLGMRPFDLDIHETPADTEAHLSQIIDAGHAVFETIHRRKDGSTWHVEATVSVSNRAGGQLVGFMRDITARKTAEELITRSLREKEVLLKEVHHRVKNNLQVVRSVLSLQTKRVADPTARRMLEESMSRVCSMALIHERLYQSKDLTCIDFKGYLQSLVEAISVTCCCPKVTCAVEMEPLLLDVNVGIPCGLIANELVSNSLRHAFPDGRKGRIVAGIFKNSQGDNVLVVGDDGIGLPPEFDFRSTSSLGLQLVNGLTEQIHGTIELSTGDGAEFRITFPGTLDNHGATHEDATR